ncbi:heterokaryon incompatibility protein-domain-containing protein, partial [Xylariales sp. PMI_506]
MRPPDPCVNRPEVFDAFQVDLRTCLSDHEECKKPDLNQLPNRVLRLDDDHPNSVFVHECRPEDQGEYVALSYCWGKTPQVKLLKANLDDFSKKGVAVSTLPKTIRDSIVATRKLGIKYLWVDSLCIIQDSVEDKDKEIVGMAKVYKNATITISAAAATDCGEGFLEDRSAVQELNLFSDEAINTRAWTYQESTLAPRLLIFGSGPPQWHCKENDSILADQTLRYMDRPAAPQDDIGSWLTWFPVLQNYSQRALSYQTDKLAALSALAAEYQSPQTGAYAAGLWKASLPRGLLW